MTKSIVSAALMMLFEEGRFRLDDPISNWLPEYTDHQVRIADGVRARVVPEARPVTVRHVLTHGFGVLANPAEAVDALSIGSFTWGGAFGTLYWADPAEDLIGIMLIQIRPYSHFNIRPMFSNVVTQAVVDSLADQRPKIMGYATPH